MALEDIKIKRRDLLKIMGSGATSVYLGACVTSTGHIPMSSAYGYGLGSINDVGPFDRSMGDVAPRQFSGDHPSLAHKILWDKKKFMSTLSANDLNPTERVKVAVVGGGVSGLLSAYMLRHHEPLLLEQAPRFGGNSRGESWNGMDYSLATAYFGVPEKDGPIDKLFKEIGVDGRYRVHEGDDSVYIAGKKYDEIWDRGTVPTSRKQFRILSKHFKDVVEEKNGKVYPNIPAEDTHGRAYINKLDVISFKQYVEKIVKEPLHPHVEEVLENYFWSAMAASSTETSAASGLNFFAGDFDKVAILPGGNGAIAEALLVRLFLEVPKRNLRPSSLVFDVRSVADGVIISYLDINRKVHTVHAETAIMSCPKFVASHLIDDMEPTRRAAIDKFRYRSYMVANILVNQHVDDSFYDLFVFDKDSENLKDIQTSAKEQKLTDVVYGSFAKTEPGRTVLTAFRAFPYDGARPEILADGAYDKYRKEFEDQIYKSLLPLLSIKPESVVDIRLARWGHPLPVSDIGNIANGLVDTVRKPYNARTFFIEQDNWTLPAFETAFHEAQTFTPQVEALLSGSQIKLSGRKNS